MVRPKKTTNKKKTKKKYPKNNNNNLIHHSKRRKNRALKKFIRNPSMSHIKINSHFIYSEIDFKEQFNKLQNKNLIKLTVKEELFLKEKINEIQIINAIDNNEDFVEISLEMSNKIKLFNTENNINDELTNFIKDKILTSENRAEIICRKLSSMYFSETGKYACKSTINDIIRNKLGFHYLKTCKKSNFLSTYLGKFSCFSFIKILLKCLMQDFILIFIDESSIKINNSNFRCWRRYNEQIFFGHKNFHRLNLILAVTKDTTLYFEINEQNTTSNIFLNFMKKINEIIKLDQNKKYLIIMDNFTGHKTADLLKYYNDEKMNILFNVQYCSYFNCIELCFRSLKKYLNNKSYDNQDKIINDIKDFLSKDELKKTLLKNYKETLQQYLLKKINMKILIIYIIEN